MKINITQKAIEELNKILKDKDMTNKYVRIHIAGFGWGGPSFGLALDELNADDLVDESNEIKVIVSKDLIEQFGNFEIDYVDNWLRKGFSVIPDHGGSSC